MAEMSPGSVKPGRLASARLPAQPTPVSSIPPHQTGTSRPRHRSWMATASLKPPMCPGLMLITLHAAISSA